jgi:YacP-like NYN domain
LHRDKRSEARASSPWTPWPDGGSPVSGLQPAYRLLPVSPRGDAELRTFEMADRPSRLEGLAYALRVEVLIVDGANVVGSRPDGWWRDRAGAARRLHERLSNAALPHDEVVLVLEGAARRGNPAGQDGRLHTVHAAGSGDDAIVKAVQAQVDVGDARGVTVVTADRVLRDRVEAAGARTVRPSWLLDQLDSAS